MVITRLHGKKSIFNGELDLMIIIYISWFARSTLKYGRVGGDSDRKLKGVDI